MKEYTLTKISSFKTDKNNNVLTTRDGKPYTRVLIKVKEHGDNIISGFGNNITAGWKVGDRVKIEIKENGQYLNFKTPSLGISRDEFQDIQDRVMGIEYAITEIREKLGKLGV